MPRPMPQLPADAMNRTVLGDPEVVKRVQWMAPLSDEQRQTNQELWDEVKTNVRAVGPDRDGQAMAPPVPRPSSP